MSSILNVKDLNCFYKKENSGSGGRKRVQILHDISFSMEEGEILGLVGESGSGKSTLAKAILNMVPDKSGTILCGDTHPQMVFQDPYGSLNPAKTIGWILEEPLKNRSRMPKEERREKAAEMLSCVGLDEKFLDRRPGELSGGQRQRICIAAALMLRPKLLIADEPVSALDVTIQAQVLKLLFSLKQEFGLSILFISHDLRVVYQICERVMIMQDGRIVEAGEAEKIYFEPQHPYTKRLLQAAGILENEKSWIEKS